MLRRLSERFVGPGAHHLRRRARTVFGLLALLAAFSAAGAWLTVGREEPRLFAVSRRVTACNSETGCPEIVGSQLVTVAYPPIVTAAIPPVWTSVDISTGKKTTRTLWGSPPGDHTGALTSPDGKWILSLDYTGEKGVLIDPVSGRCTSLHVVGDSYHYKTLWSPDSRSFIYTGSVPGGAITVYPTVDPAHPRTLRFPPADDAEWMDFSVAHPDRLFVIDRGNNSDETIENGADIREYRMGKALDKVRLHSIRLPFPGAVEQIAISPRGDRIAWVCSEHRQDALTRFMHRFVPRWPSPTTEVCTVWTSDLDGNRFREIGSAGAMTNDDPHLSVDWNQTGSELTFVHNRALYRVRPD